MLNDTDAAFGVVTLALCFRMSESLLHQRKIKSKPHNTHQHLTRDIVLRKPN